MKVNKIKFLPAILSASVLSLTSCQKDEILDNNNVNQATQQNTTANRYLVSMKSGASDEQIQKFLLSHHLTQKGFSKISGKVFNGISLELTPAQLAELQADGSIDLVEPDQIFSLGYTGNDNSNKNQGSQAPAFRLPSTLEEATSGSITPASSTTTTSYTITPLAGQIISWGATQLGIGDGASTGRTAWIIDSGIQLNHPDLNVDVERSRSFISASTSPDDQFGHGTQVAGILAAKNNGFGVVGIASGATVVSLRVMDSRGAGTVSSVISALNYVAQNAQPGDVVNLSLGASPTVTLDNAVIAVANLGIFVTIAAGNSSADAANYSPARVDHPNVFTVSGRRADNTYMGISNWGSPIDISAPGNSLQSTKINGTYGSVGGTSMASPHVAGILLLRGDVPTSGFVLNDPDGMPDPKAVLQ